MRGLGIGIILTTLIFVLANPKEKLSEAEIKNEAAKLGMVMAEEQNDKLEDVLDKIKPSISPTDTPSVEPTITPATDLTQLPTILPTPTLAPTKKPTPTITPTVTEKPIPTKTSNPTEEENTQGNGSDINFTIKSGMSSVQVAKILEEMGLIDDADKFNDYIVKKGKASIIRVGTYSIQDGATYDQIITVITAK